IYNNDNWYKYMWTWVKSNVTNFANAKKQPLRKCEQILVFYDKPPVYNPQGAHKILPGEKYSSKSNNYQGNGWNCPVGDKQRTYPIKVQQPHNSGNGVDPDRRRDGTMYTQEQTGYLTDILYFARKIVKRDWDNFHPTQKP